MMEERRIERLKAISCLVCSAVIVGLFNFKSTMVSNTSSSETTLRGHPAQEQLAIDAPPIYIPPSLDTETQRRLSLNLGGGACKWEPPEYEVPNNIAFYKTLIAGFPSCDKRMTFTQMEALTGWPARDEWDFVFYGMANHPFIKSNYPHHEGYWSWGTLADQVVMVVRNMRRTMVEYHDILWDIGTAKKSNLSYLDVLYKYRPPISSFFEWRDLRVMDEIKWYGWFIDYWMEGGLRRDIFTHKLTTEEAWPYLPDAHQEALGQVAPDCLDDPWHAHTEEPNVCTNSGVFIRPTHSPTKSPTPSPTQSPTETNYTRPENYTLPPPTFDVPEAEVPFLFATSAACCSTSFPGQQCYLLDTCPTPAPTPAIVASYDLHCSNNEIANGCEPVAVISAEKLRDLDEGPAETIAIANVLTGRPGISEYLIGSDAWNCIWQELIPRGKGIRTVQDRGGYVEDDYNFSEEMLAEMVVELDRLITKYSGTLWSVKPTANRLVELLMEHRSLIQMEYNDVKSGARQLTDRDFLGPKERERRRLLKAQSEGMSPDDVASTVQEKRKHFEYFMALEEKVKTTRRADRAKERQEERRAAAMKKREDARKLHEQKR